jgi:3-oxoacyl-[acyl-carrier protein] reductase
MTVMTATESTVKSVLITGAGSGIGQETARYFARNGYTVVIGEIDADAAQRTVDLIDSDGGKAQAVHLDVSKRDSAHQGVEDAISKVGRIDVLVNNAALQGFQTIEDLDESTVDALLSVDFKGVLWTSQALIGKWRQTEPGSIINIASIAAFGGAPGSSVYAGIKNGVIAVTKTIANEVGPDGIRVNAVAPGLVQTPGTSFLDEEAVNKRIQRAPLRRTASAEEIAQAVHWLASDNARYVTGHTLVVDGGATGNPF